MLWLKFQLLILNALKIQNCYKQTYFSYLISKHYLNKVFKACNYDIK